ncbi:MAG: NAD(P)/FAD-dependent oxidoreductase [Rhizobiaceae bacterium]
MNAGTLPYDVIVLGAGGAGLMCALTAGQRGLRVLVIDHADAPGKKILISGGGRCNFTNTGTTASRFICSNPHFAKSALARYQPDDFIKLVEKHNIAWHEKTLGQLFCDGSAKQIVRLLLDECEAGSVKLRLRTKVQDIQHKDGGFLVDTSKGRFAARSLVVATGGPSIPKLGASGFAYDLARQFGLKVVEPRPALVPFTLSGEEALFRDLSGVATDTDVGCGKQHFREASLFTHKGLSGPAMLQISSYWRHGDSIHVDFLPDRPANWLLEAKRNSAKSTLNQILSADLPNRLAEVLCTKLGMERSLSEVTDKALAAAQQKLHCWPFAPNGTEGFAKAEVTVGGISTDELSSKTMASKKQPGLYFIGEAVDVTGWLGGYNFQWAWASGVAAGEALEFG